jgi:serine/threonine-protein kinase
VPRNVAAALRRAIEKLPGDRFESAAAFAAALADIHYVDPAAKAVAVPLRQNRPALLMAGVAALALLSAGWSYIRQPRSAPPRPLARLVVAVPDSERLTTSAGRRIAFTPDGRAFVYVGEGPAGTRLLLRSLDAIESTPIAGSEGATNPAFSPDGETIAFVSFGPFAIRTIPRAGGTATTIAGGTNLVSGGGVDWGADGWIYFDGGTGIARVRPDGSAREVVAPMKPLEAAAWPTILPNGRAVLMRVRRTGDTEQQYTIEAVDLRTRVRKTVVHGLAARYDPAGYLLYVSARGELYAQRFDQDRVEVRGEPVLLWSGLSVATFGAVDVAVSPSGALLYTAGDIGPGARREVIWAGRDGTMSPVDSPAVAGLVSAVALSHDGTRIALEIHGATQVDGSDIWVKQLGGGPLSQVSRGGRNWSPSWSADDRSLLFMSDRDSAIGLFRQRADGSNAAVLEVPGLDVNAEYGAASDGRTLIFRLNRGPGGGDLFSLRPGIDTAVTPLFPGPALERAPALSPDGHWLAYTSDESGRGEVYVRPFPSVDSARIPVSTAGGARPRWNHAGTELFYKSASNDLMSARRLPGPGMRFDRPVVLFDLSRVFELTTSPWYDIAPDDRRFVMIQSGLGSGGRRTDRLVFVDDIRPELAKRVLR